MPVFSSPDVRVEYSGKGVGGSKSGAKMKTGSNISANFQTPMVPKSSLRGSASDSDGRQSMKGEKSKVKKKVVTPPSTPVVDSAAGGCNEGESSTDDQSGNDTGSCFPKRKLNDLCRHLGDGRGGCFIVLCYCVIVLFWCR